MPWGLKRFQQSHQLHFVTFSCYRRRANFVNDRRLALEQLPPLSDGRGGNGRDRIAMDGATEGEDGNLPEGAGALEMKAPPKRSLDGAPEKVRLVSWSGPAPYPYLAVRARLGKARIRSFHSSDPGGPGHQLLPLLAQTTPWFGHSAHYIKRNYHPDKQQEYCCLDALSHRQQPETHCQHQWPEHRNRGHPHHVVGQH